MKKKYILSILPIILLGACSNGLKETDAINILAPKGAPAVAFYKHATDSNFTTAAAENIKSMLTKKSPYTIVVVDTLSGVSALKNKAPYKLAATITFGNFYLAATGNDENGTLDVGDRIIVFNRGAVSDKIFHYVYGDIYDDYITYVPDATIAKGCLETKKDLENNPVDYVFIAQPALFAAMQTNADASVYDNIQQRYQEKSGSNRIIQASVFVKKNLKKEAADAFLSELSTDITEGLANPATIKSEMEKAGDNVVAKFGVGSAPAFKVTQNGNGMGLGFAYSKDIKDEIDASLAVYGVSATNEEMYY